MDRIKTKLIHLLGGYTDAETSEMMCDSREKGIAAGKFLARREMLIYAQKELYGLSAEEWCQKMYERLTKEE